MVSEPFAQVAFVDDALGCVVWHPDETHRRYWLDLERVGEHDEMIREIVPLLVSGLEDQCTRYLDKMDRMNAWNPALAKNSTLRDVRVFTTEGGELEWMPEELLQKRLQWIFRTQNGAQTGAFLARLLATELIALRAVLER